MRKPPLIPVLILTLFAIGWGGYWFVGAGVTERAMSSWFEARRAEGWVAEVTSVKTRGFPNRFDTTFEGLRLSDPETGVGWETPLFQTLSLSYRPTQIISVWPGPQVLTTPAQRLTIEGESVRASMAVRAAANLPITASTMEAVDATFASSNGWTAAVGRAQLSLRETPEAAVAHSYDLALMVENLDPGEEFRARVGGVGGLPDLLSSVTARATVTFTEPWDRYAIERARPQPRHVQIDSLEAQWGALHLAASGTLEADAEGVPSGQIAIAATNWREMIAVAEATGAISPDWVKPITRALDYLSGRSGDPETLELTMTFSKGFTFLGAIPVGPAPDLRMP